MSMFGYDLGGSHTSEVDWTIGSKYVLETVLRYWIWT